MAITDSELTAWTNGRFAPLPELQIHVTEPGIFLGVALAEAFRTFNLKPFRMPQHLARLARSMRETGIQPAYSTEQMGQIVLELVERNRKLLPAEGELRFDMLITPATTAIWTKPVDFALLGQQYRDGLGLVIPSTRQIPAVCLQPRIKHRNRLHFHQAGREAAKIEPGSWPVLLDQAGNLAETPAANLFIVRKGELATPSTINCLAGDSRAFVLELAREEGIPALECELQPYDLETADEAFLTNISMCAMPAVRVNKWPIGAGKRGPMVDRLMAAWSRRVGVDIPIRLLSNA